MMTTNNFMGPSAEASLNPDLPHTFPDREYRPGSVARLCLLLLAVLLCTPLSSAAKPTLILTRTGLTANDLAVIVNDDDPLSVRIGAYYQKVRHIPAGNMIHLHFPAGLHTMEKDEFQKLKSRIDSLTPAHVQAYAVAWTNPYRVGCMSITSALAFGFDDAYCSAQCRPTKPSPYFDSTSLAPATDFRMRPAMLLAGTDFEQVKKLIDRGVASDRSYPKGRAYLLNTSDKSRDVRSAYFAQTAKQLSGVFPIDVLKADAIANRHDVLFYFTGMVQVPQLDTLHFLPGALADHLTSLGGELTDSTQMSILRWLDAGATASYGTVVEPCNYPQKFPFPGVAMYFYASGASAIEAYWKSVAWPGEGVFVGEPLARPFAPGLRETGPGRYELTLFSPRKGQFRIESSKSIVGPYLTVARQPIHRGLNVLDFSVPDTETGYARLLW